MRSFDFFLWSVPEQTFEQTVETPMIPGATALIITSMQIDNIQGAVSIRKTVLPGMAIPMLKIRRPNGRLIFNMEITIRR